MVKPIVNNSSNLPTKRRKLVSRVWEDFVKVKDGDATERAICNHCQKSFVGSSKSGTTHLKNHLKCCRGKIREEGSADEETCLVDPLEVVKTIIKRGLTLKSIKTDVRHIYRVEKAKLCRCLSELSCRISLTIDDMWIPFDNYMCVAAYFIDDSWQQKNKILALKYLEFEGDPLETLKGLLLDWKIDKNICSVVAVNIDDVDEIKSWLSDLGNLFPVSGELLQFGYLVNILTSNDVSEIAFEVIQKIRGLFDYVFGTLSNENKFQKAVERATSRGKKASSGYVNPTTLVLNDFKLLGTAVEFKEAFDELEQIDSDFKSINLTKEDWNEAEAVCQCWKELNDFPHSFSESIFPPAHSYFSKVCEIYMTLLFWEKNESWSVRQIGSSLRRKIFNEYRRNSILIIAIIVVLDPRFKMDIIEHWYKKIYGSDHETELRKIMDEITIVYNEYLSSGMVDNATSSASHEMSGNPGDDVDQSANSEFNRYVEEPKLPLIDEFDILTWWRMNAQNFPILARMARDFLAIPFSTTLSNSALKAKMQNLLYSVDLGSDIREAFVCTKFWLENP